MELVKIDSNGKRTFEIDFNGKKIDEIAFNGFLMDFGHFSQKRPKEVELILNMRNGLQFMSKPSDSYLNRIVWHWLFPQFPPSN